jgi:hypothetical protein
VVLADFRAEGWAIGDCVVEPGFDAAASRAKLPAPLTDASEEFDEEEQPREIIKYTVVERASAGQSSESTVPAGKGVELDASLFVGIALGFGAAAVTGLVMRLAGRPEK